jgi:hypothetical protein
MEVNMFLSLSIEGARPDEIKRGLAAAQAVFDASGVTVVRVANARFAVEGWDIGGFAEAGVDDEDLEIHGLWDNASGAALAACCAGWEPTRRPDSAILELVKTRRTEFDLEVPDDPSDQLDDETIRKGVIYELHDLTKGADRVREVGTIQYFESFSDWFPEDGPWQAPPSFTSQEAEAVGNILALMREAETSSREISSDDAFIQTGWPDRVKAAASPVLALLVQRGLAGDPPQT